MALPCIWLPLRMQLERLDGCRGAGLEENCSSGKACCITRLKNPQIYFFVVVVGVFLSKRLAERTCCRLQQPGWGADF